MTIGSVTMSKFGWFAITLECCCITLKTCYLWKDGFRYRYGVNRKVGACAVFGSFFLTEITSEYSGLTGKTGVVSVLLALFLCMAYLLTENNFEIMGLTLIYWFVSYLPWLILESVTGLFPMSEGSIRYYQTPQWVLPNIAILLAAFFCMLHLWKKRILHRIARPFCIALCLFTNVTEYLHLAGTTGKNYISLQEILRLLVILIAYTGIPVGMTLFYSIRQRQKTKIAETCRGQFYEQISKIQHEAGKFRHDLANHMQVINRYREEDVSKQSEQQLQQNESQEYGQKLQQYGQKLQQRKSELETGSYSGNKRMDFILEQIRQLALARGCVLEIRWEADEKGKLKNEIPEEEPENKCMTEEYIAGKNDAKKEETDTAESTTEESISEKEMEELTDRCLEAVASRSFWWIVGKYSGKKMKETLRIFRKDGTLHGRIRRR